MPADVALPLTLTDVVKAARELLSLIDDLALLVMRANNWLQRHEARRMARQLRVIAFLPDGILADLNRVSVSFTLENVRRMQARLGTTEAAVRRATGVLRKFRDRIAEKYGLEWADRLAWILDGPTYGKGYLREGFFDLASRMESVLSLGESPDGIVASTSKLLSAIEHLNAEIRNLHDALIGRSHDTPTSP